MICSKALGEMKEPHNNRMQPDAARLRHLCEA